MARSSLQDILQITGSILPGIQRSRQRAEDRLAVAAEKKAQDALNARQRDIALDFSLSITGSEGDRKNQALVLTARENYNLRVKTLLEQKGLDGTRKLSAIEISQDDQIVKTFGALQEALDQAGPRDIRARRFAIEQKFQELLPGYPGDPKLLIEIKNAALNQVTASNTIGEAEQQGLITAADVKKKYDEVNIENFTSLTILRQEANTLGVTMEQVTNANLGLNMESVILKMVNLSTEANRQQWILDVTQSPGDLRLSGKAELDAVFARIDTSANDMIEFITAAVQKDTRRGGGPVNREALQQGIELINNNAQKDKDFYSTQTDVAYHISLNKLVVEATKLGAGSEIDHMRTVIDVGGPQARDILLGTILKRGPEQEVAIAKWNKLMEGIPVKRDAASMLRMSSQIGQRIPNPQTSFFTTPLAINIASQATPTGQVKEVVVQHALNGLVQLINKPDDMPAAIEQLSRPEFTKKVLNGDARTQTDFVELNNKMVKKLIRDAAANGDTITALEEIKGVKVSQFRRVRTSDFTPNIGFAAGGPGLDEGELIEIVDAKASTAFSKYYKELIVSGRYAGLLPDSDDFFKEIKKVSKEFGATFVHPRFSPTIKDAMAFTPPSNIQLNTDLLSGINRDPEFVQLLEKSSTLEEFTDKFSKLTLDRESRREASKAAQEKVEAEALARKIKAAQGS